MIPEVTPCRLEELSFVCGMPGSQMQQIRRTPGSFVRTQLEIQRKWLTRENLADVHVDLKEE